MFTDRKSPRIPGYDYAVPNYYFITICTDKHKYLFWTDESLNQYGKIAGEHMQKISDIYPGVEILKFVIMPNHLHAIVAIHADSGTKCGNDLRQIVGQYKMSVTKEMHAIGYPNAVWQRSFHDHIIRNEKSYQDIWKYIDNNPLQWELDCFYQKADSEDRWEGHCPSPTMDGESRGR